MRSEGDAETADDESVSAAAAAAAVTRRGCGKRPAETRRRSVAAEAQKHAAPAARYDTLVAVPTMTSSAGTRPRSHVVPARRRRSFLLPAALDGELLPVVRCRRALEDT